MNPMESPYAQATAFPFTDSLTGLFHHGFFLVYLEQQMHRLLRHGRPLTLAMVDVDDLALHNERHGAVSGERALVQVAGIIGESIRKGDIAARYAGDRFALLFVGEDADRTVPAAERIRAAVEDRTGGELTVSIGLASADARFGEGHMALIQRALATLHRAKGRGKNRIERHQPEMETLRAGAARILLVDDEPLNLKILAGMLAPLGHEIYRASTGRDALRAMGHVPFDLVLLDVMMPELDGYAVCRAIKASEETRMIPVVMLTALENSEAKVRGIEAGADDFITKPPNRAELIARVQSLVRVRRLNKNLTSMENVLFSMAKTVEAKDSYTQGHVDRVSALALAIGHRAGLDEDRMAALRYGGALHDIGKMGVPEEILNKPGPLNAEEWAVMKRHTELGYQICLPLKKNLQQALDVIRHHHEKLDGSGYPDGLRGAQISIVARIMSVADIYDALITDRPYRKAMSRKAALAILAEEADAGKLDRSMVAHLADVVCDTSASAQEMAVAGR